MIPTERGGRHGQSDTHDLKELRCAIGSEPRTLLDSLQNAFAAATVEVRKIFSKPSLRFEPMISEWDTLRPRLFYDLPLRDAFHGQRESLVLALKRMVDNWGENDKRYDANTKKGELYENNGGDFLARVDVDKGIISLRLREDGDKTLEKMHDIESAIALELEEIDRQEEQRIRNIRADMERPQFI